MLLQSKPQAPCYQKHKRLCVGLSSAQFRVDLVDRPDALWPDAPPALVPVFSPLILERWTQLDAEASLLQTARQPAGCLFAALVCVEGQDRGFHLVGIPFGLCCRADQGYHTGWRKA